MDVEKGYELPENKEEKQERIKELENCWNILTAPEYWFVRNCLRGGRTDVRKLYHKLSENEIQRGCKICYVDVVSMYPAVQVKYDYPVGIPEIRIYDAKYYPCKKQKCQTTESNYFEFCNCCWYEKSRSPDRSLNIKINILDDGMGVRTVLDQPTEQEILNSFGFICVSGYYSNKHIYHPPLVMFDPKTKKCTASLEDIQEGFFTTEEFKEALKVGFKITKVHRIDHYKRAPGLWNDLMKKLFIEKMVNSGPAPESMEEREHLVNEYEEKFGLGEEIASSFSRMKYDGVLRTVYKILQNCAWGKHCERPNVDEHFLFNEMEDQSELWECIQNEVHKLKRWDQFGIFTDITVGGGDLKENDFTKTYIPAGCYVPAYGRLTLYNQMKRLGDRVLYHDTDSIIYLYDPQQYNIRTSETWGEWEEEKVSIKGISEFVSIGPKSYGIRTFDGEESLKLKGLSLKYSHHNLVTFDTLKTFVLNDAQKLMIPQFGFNYTPGNGMVTNYYQKKLDFQPDDLKGDLVGLKVYPFGYSHQ
jgi:hypothetical protein